MAAAPAFVAQVSAHTNPKTQRNFTDPESKLMKTKGGFMRRLICTAHNLRKLLPVLARGRWS